MILTRGNLKQKPLREQRLKIFLKIGNVRFADLPSRLSGLWQDQDPSWQKVFDLKLCYTKKGDFKLKSPFLYVHQKP